MFLINFCSCPRFQLSNFLCLIEKQGDPNLKKCYLFVKKQNFKIKLLLINFSLLF
ncbi:MAG: hypothetical protein EAZ97_16150 [Bacteroidetes bacterium]|nr:MAG: hypothetical protein EAZ97_16150 [Bacteroidota bacterium]